MKHWIPIWVVPAVMAGDLDKSIRIIKPRFARLKPSLKLYSKCSWLAHSYLNSKAIWRTFGGRANYMLY